MGDDPDRVLEQPANDAVLRYLQTSSGLEAPPSEPPASIPDVYFRLGTHPDLVEWLWVTLAAELPVDCSWVVYRRPVLRHSASGIIFAFAGGTHMYALRLPEAERSEVFARRSSRQFLVNGKTWLDLDDLGVEWAFGSWQKDEARWCRAAYDLAGRAPDDPPSR